MPTKLSKCILTRVQILSTSVLVGGKLRVLSNYYILNAIIGKHRLLLVQAMNYIKIDCNRL